MDSDFRILTAFLSFAVPLGIVGIFIFFFKPIIVSGDSMYPTLKNHDLVFTYRQFVEIDNNDIVVFNKDDSLVIKRAIAVSGDKVELKNNGVYINDIRIQPFTYEGDDKNYSLRENELFVIGDNYSVSYDSRDYGLISTAQVIGIVKK